MYDAERARLEELRARFDRAAAERGPDARTVADEYLAALAQVIRAVDSGPAADPAVAHVDTTGQVGRLEEWAEGSGTGCAGRSRTSAEGGPRGFGARHCLYTGDRVRSTPLLSVPPRTADA